MFEGVLRSPDELMAIATYRAKEIERLTAESETYRQEYVRVGCENTKLQARVDELESALRGYVKATTGQESATVTFPMALEGEVK